MEVLMVMESYLEGGSHDNSVEMTTTKTIMDIVGSKTSFFCL